MRAAVRRIDIVDKRKYAFCIAIVMLERHFHKDTVLYAAGIKNIVIKRLAALIQVCDKLLNAALVMKCALLLYAFPPVNQVDFQPLRQESRFPQTLFERFIGKNRFLEYRCVRQEVDECPMFLRIPDHSQRGHYIAALIFLFVYFPFRIDAHSQPVRKRVYNRCAHAMQAAGNLVAPAAELTARVQYGKNDLNRRQALLLLYADRDAPAVIPDGNRVIRMYRHRNFTAMARQSLIYRIIYDFINQMV